MHALLAQPRLSLMTRYPDSEMVRLHEVLDHKVLVDGRVDVEECLSRLARCAGPRTPKTLDLIGHSMPGASLLQLGDWVLDASSATVTAFFRELADNEVLPRLGVHAVRLLGCKTAETAQARSTICVLSDILGLEVYGTMGIVFSAHYNRHGFSDDWRFLLIGSSDVRRMENREDQRVPVSTDTRWLDVDALPAVALDTAQAHCPRRVASDRVARSILRLIKRDEGAQMPGLLALPTCEIAIPSGTTGLYHLAQVVLDGQFLRVYPDGTSRAGVLYPVAQPQALRSLVEQLPAAS